jgi:hypothetical protein
MDGCDEEETRGDEEPGVAGIAGERGLAPFAVGRGVDRARGPEPRIAPPSASELKSMCRTDAPRVAGAPALTARGAGAARNVGARPVADVGRRSESEERELNAGVTGRDPPRSCCRGTTGFASTAGRGTGSE